MNQINWDQLLLVLIKTEVLTDGKHFTKHIWFRYFHLAQGDEGKEDALMQDDESCSLLHKHFNVSVGKGSKHMHVRYFFVIDKMKKKEVKFA